MKRPYRKLTACIALISLCPPTGCWVAAWAQSPAQSQPVLKKLVPKVAPQPENLPVPSPSPAKTGVSAKTDASQVTEVYPLVAQLEQITFGGSKPTAAVADRLSQLENAVFHKTFTNLSLQDRIQQLSDTLLGPTTRANLTPPAIQQTSLDQQAAKPVLTEDSLWNTPEYQRELSPGEAQKFALIEINDQRQNQGLPPLAEDEIACRVAREHVEDLTGRHVVSHSNTSGDNPDMRYTRAGGSDALSESLVKLDGQSLKPNRAAIGRLIKILNSHEDDRESLLSPDATHFGFSLASSPDKKRLIGCVEIVTRHAILHPIPSQVEVGEKIGVTGVVLEPYKFQRVTIAWEGLNTSKDGIEEEEPLPYFPPLDFVAYGKKAEHADHERAANALRASLMVAAIAGSIFIPPVALAAPLIAMSATGPSEPHPVSEIPVHGGVKVEGSTFSGSLPINNAGKEGLYYVTVWATTDADSKPIPISRRTVIATLLDKENSKKHISEKATGHIATENTQQ